MILIKYFQVVLICHLCAYIPTSQWCNVKYFMQ